MVIRTRLRAILIPLALYVVSGSATSFFVWSAINGERGAKAKAEYQRQLVGLEAELGELKLERARWANRVSLMRGETVDRDIVDELARAVLGRVDRRDLVIYLPAKK